MKNNNRTGRDMILHEDIGIYVRAVGWKGREGETEGARNRGKWMDGLVQV
jgi:hypothetical protein